MFKKKAFSFSADCKALEQAVKSVAATVGSSAALFVGVYKKTIAVIGLSSDTFALRCVPNATTDADAGLFAFDGAILPGLIKNRSVMEFAYKGNECTFSQVKGKYSGKLNTLDITEDQLTQLSDRVQEKVQGAVALSGEVLAQIRHGLAATAIKDVYQNTALLSYVIIKGGRVQISSFDAQHFGLYKSKVDSDVELRVALPQSHFTLVEQMAANEAVKFSVSQAGLRALGKSFIVALPATQAEDKHFTMVSDFIKAQQKPVYEASCDMEALVSVADNLFTLYNTNSNFMLQSKGSALRLSLSTSSGSASDAIKAETKSKDMKMAVDPRLMNDVLALSKAVGDPLIKVTDKIFAVSGKSGDGDVFLACSRVE